MRGQLKLLQSLSETTVGESFDFIFIWSLSCLPGLFWLLRRDLSSAPWLSERAWLGLRGRRPNQDSSPAVEADGAHWIGICVNATISNPLRCPGDMGRALLAQAGVLFMRGTHKSKRRRACAHPHMLGIFGQRWLPGYSLTFPWVPGL